MLENDIALVMLTYRRQRYALRNMHLWSGSKVKVYVLDGSSTAIPEEKLKSFAKNIIYMHLPISLMDRLASVRDIVDSKYVAFMGDDDFFIPSAVVACTLELEKNSELVACIGRCMGKNLLSDLIVTQSEIENIDTGDVGNVIEEDPIGRMVEHMDPYSPSSIYSVCRISHWKQIVHYMSAQRYTCNDMGEMPFELAMSFCGKIKIIDEIMWLRSEENPQQSVEHELPFYKWYIDDRYEKEVNSFLDRTSQELNSIRKDISLETIRKGLHQASLTYVGYCQRRNFPHYNFTPRLLNQNIVISNVRNKFKSYIRKLSSKIPERFLSLVPSRIRFRPYADIAKAYERKGVRVDWEAFNAILKSVRDFHRDDSKY